MTKTLTPHAAALAVALCAATGLAERQIEPIETVAVGQNRELRVNGKPFFPVMMFEQTASRIRAASALGANTLVENDGDESNKEFLDKLRESGLYGVLGADMEVVDDPYLLGLIHLHQPDEPIRVRRPDIEPGQELHINRSYPLERVVDGDTDRGAIIDPLAGGRFTIRLKAPVTVHSLAVWLDDYGSFSVAKEMAFFGDGKEILRTALKKGKGEQRFALDEPAMFRDLTVQVMSTHPGYSQRTESVVGFGRVNEIMAFDADGKGVPLYEIRTLSKIPAAQVLVAHRWMKRVEKTRPAFLTLSPAFMDAADEYDPDTKQRLYSLYTLMCDFAGVAFGRCEPRETVADGVSELLAVAGPLRGVYAWIPLGEIPPSGGGSTGPEPEALRAAVWSAIIHGATGIGYCIPAARAEETRFSLSDAMLAELTRVNGQITRLTDAILANPAKASIETELHAGQLLRFKATETDRGLYIFAQRIDQGPADQRSQPQPAVVRIEGLPAGAKIEVIDENRVITADEGQFTDNFDPLAVHIYRVPEAR